MARGARVLVLWNAIEEDVYEHIRREGKRVADWDASVQIPDVGTIADDFVTMQRALEAHGHRVDIVNIGNSVDALRQALASKPDVVFNLVEFFGNDPAHEFHLCSYYELVGQTYTGARPAALSLCQRKPRAKAVMAAAGVPTAPYVVIDPAPDKLKLGIKDAVKLGFPLIVKPAYEDASNGIDTASVVKTRAALVAKVTHVAAEFQTPVLVERFIDGREIHCAVLARPDQKTGVTRFEALPLYEMEFNGSLDEHGKPLPRIITYRAKWDPHSRDFHSVDSCCPAEGLTRKQERELSRIALLAAEATEVRDYARVDMRLEEGTGNIYVLEVNPNPDLSDGSSYCQAAAADDLDYGMLLDHIVRLALERAPAARKGPAPGQRDILLEAYRERAGQARSAR